MPALMLHDCAPRLDDFHAEVIQGLSQDQKTLPCKFFYDDYGSQLFDQICDLPEYYPTRTEAAIMHEYGSQMAAAIGPHARLVEYGSGSSLKTRILLDHLPCPSSYVPMDISGEHLMRSAANLAASYPHLEVLPVCADYTQGFTLPEGTRPFERTVIYFPGSTIGNFHPTQARAFLADMAAVAGPSGGLLIGVDLRKSPTVLEPAYNDSQGVTAAFNKNLLTRINQELDGTFDLETWDHHAFYNDSVGRIEMHLMSLCDQIVHIGAKTFVFLTDETIWTECSYKYDLSRFADLAGKSGWRVEHVWTDAENKFSVQFLQPSAHAR
jgi:dimethylhistidine N-methyltransferase